MNGFTLNRSTKDSTKVALAITISLVLALWFGWEKPYWAAITVSVAAANETYSHSIRKGRNRLLGTIAGICCAVIFVSLFPQQHLMFVLAYGALLGICVFMASHKKYGYAFTMAATVCALVTIMGSFDGATSFHIAILRIQETLLGLVIFGLVFGLLWPTKVEDSFFEVLSETSSSLNQRFTALCDGQFELNAGTAKLQRNNLSKLKAILDLPLNGSPKLLHEKSAWRIAIQAMELLEVIFESEELLDSVDLADIKEGKSLLQYVSLEPMYTRQELQVWLEQMNLKYTISRLEYSAFDLPLKGRLMNVVRSLSIFFTGFAIWFYVPLPGSFLMPMMICIFANILVTLPNQLFGQMIIGVVVWATIFLAQYVLIMPLFTEVWQLAAFYFVNAFFVWRVTSTPSLALQKVMGLNFLMVMTMSATYLTPSYSIITAITILTAIGISLSIGGFYIKLYRNL